LAAHGEAMTDRLSWIAAALLLGATSARAAEPNYESLQKTSVAVFDLEPTLKP